VGYELFTGIKERQEKGKSYVLLGKFVHWTEWMLATLQI
jgi:hypothetical protein